ncbi:MAG: hypothetical protein AB7H97_19835, partial [Pseudobdellovibrionaceae bacterium]
HPGGGMGGGAARGGGPGGGGAFRGGGGVPGGGAAVGRGHHVAPGGGAVVGGGNRVVNPGIHRPANPIARPGGPGVVRPGPGRPGHIHNPPNFKRHNYRGWIGRGHRGYAPLWWGAIIAGGYLSWRWYDSTPYGYWQCLAFNEHGRVFSGYGVDVDQAATSAIDRCQRSSGYRNDACFIPENYCRRR